MLTTVLQSIKKKIPTGGFLKNVVVLTSGTGFTHIAAALFVPMITRLYSPSDLGLLAVYSSMLSLLVVIGSWRYEIAIPNAEDEETAVNLLCLALIILLTMFLLLSIVCGTIYLSGLGKYNYLGMICFGFLGAGAYQIFNYWAVRKKLFSQIAKTKITQGLGLQLTQIVLGLLHLGPLGLIVGDIVGRVSGLRVLAKPVWREHKSLLNKVTISSLRIVASKYKQYPRFSLLSALISTSSTQIPILLLSEFFGSVVTGWFSLAVRILLIPVTFIGQSISQAFYIEACEANNRGTLANSVVMVLEVLSIIGTAPMIFLAVIAPQLFAIVFGVKWYTAGVYLRWLVPWILLIFMASPVSTIIFVLEKQRTELFFQIVLLSSRLVALFAGVYIYNANVGVFLYGVISGLVWLIYLLWIVDISGNNKMAVLSRIIREIAISFILVTPLLVSNKFCSKLTVAMIAAACGLIIVIYQYWKIRGIKSFLKQSFYMV